MPFAAPSEPNVYIVYNGQQYNVTFDNNYNYILTDRTGQTINVPRKNIQTYVSENQRTELLQLLYKCDDYDDKNSVVINSPNDIGMFKIAFMYEDTLREVLKKNNEELGKLFDSLNLNSGNKKFYSFKIFVENQDYFILVSKEDTHIGVKLTNVTGNDITDPLNFITKAVVPLRKEGYFFTSLNSGKKKAERAYSEQLEKKKQDQRELESNLVGKNVSKTIIKNDLYIKKHCNDLRISNEIKKKEETTLSINAFRSSFINNSGLQKWLKKNKKELEDVFDNIVLKYLRMYFYLKMYQYRRSPSGVIPFKEARYDCYQKIIDGEKKFIGIYLSATYAENSYLVVPLEWNLTFENSSPTLEELEKNYKELIEIEFEEFCENHPNATFVGNDKNDGKHNVGFLGFLENVNYYDVQGNVVKGKGGSKKHKSKRRRNQSVKGSRKQKQRRTKRKQ